MFAAFTHDAHEMKQKDWNSLDQESLILMSDRTYNMQCVLSYPTCRSHPHTNITLSPEVFLHSSIDIIRNVVLGSLLFFFFDDILSLSLVDPLTATHTTITLVPWLAIKLRQLIITLSGYTLFLMEYWENLYKLVI